MKRLTCGLLAVVLCAATGFVIGAELKGVTLPDDLEVEGQALVLNGLGLRLATFLKVKVYVAGLYLESKSTDPGAILGTDQTRLIDMHFLRKVGQDDMTEAWSEGFEKNGLSGFDDPLATLGSYMEAVKPGDTMRFTYVPGTGTTISVKGVDKGTIEGADFAKALFTVFLGEVPPNAELKKGLLGG